MDAEQFRRYRILGKLGLFSIEPSAPGARRLLRIGPQILAQPQAMLWLTPQARFADARERPLHFAGGLAGLALRAQQAQLVPLALEYEHWQERLPEVLVRFGQVRAAGEVCASFRHPRDVTAQLETDLIAAMDALAQDSITRDPNQFKTLLAGSEAISPIYDTARRIRARLRGEAFRVAHNFASR